MAEVKIPELPSNTQTTQEEKKKPLDVEILGDVPITENKPKKSLGSRFKNAFISCTKEELEEHIIQDVIIPGIIDVVSNIMYSSVDMIFYGGSGTATGRHRRRNRRSGSKTDYTASFDNPVRRTKSASGYSLDDVFFSSKDDADATFEDMCESLEEYGEVTVYDFYDMARDHGATAPVPDHTDKNYGWKTLEHTGYLMTPDGWVLKLPKPKVLKD